MGISRDSTHKRRETGGKRVQLRKKRKFELGRPPAMTKMGPKRVNPVRCMGGNMKYRALRLETGNFSWGSEVCTRKTRLLDVMYNASDNELLRTKTLVKNAIVQVDAAPFRMWYEAHYGVELGRKKKGKKEEDVKEEEKKSFHVQRKLKQRQADRVIPAAIEDQLASGRVLACISSRPGQSGRCDGYVLEGDELAFYQKLLSKKKKGAK